MPLGPPKQRAVLALLASRAGEVVGVDNIVDALWDGDIPQTATNGVHTYVAGLRRALEPGRSRREAGAILTSVSGGYCLRMDPEQVDATLFTRRHARARRSRIEGSPDEAVRWYEEALALWRGDAYSGVPGPFAAVERTRLRDLRLTAVEEWAADMLDAGRHAEAVAELSAAVGEEPLREKLRWLLMLTLYRSGRQAHALAVYTETRQLLNRELGIEPGAELRSLHQQILAGHPRLRREGEAAAARAVRRHPGGAPICPGRSNFPHRRVASWVAPPNWRGSRSCWTTSAVSTARAHPSPSLTAPRASARRRSCWSWPTGCWTASRTGSSMWTCAAPAARAGR
ncbi:AfsR/SARP family transcriptional regulator [Streptomyces microflavus]